jgi:hypothetical protein
MKALNRHVERVFNPDRKETHWGKRKLKRDNDCLGLEGAAEKWFAENDPEGVAFEYEVWSEPSAGSGRGQVLQICRLFDQALFNKLQLKLCQTGLQ